MFEIFTKLQGFEQLLVNAAVGGIINMDEKTLQPYNVVSEGLAVGTIIS